MLARTMTSKRRSLSKLSRAGDEASRATRRSLLLDALTAADWNLSHAAETLEMHAAADVLRAIKELDLVEVYEQARLSRASK